MIGKPVYHDKMVKTINYDLLTYCTHSDIPIERIHKFSLLQMSLFIKCHSTIQKLNSMGKYFSLFCDILIQVCNSFILVRQVCSCNVKVGIIN